MPTLNRTTTTRPWMSERKAHGRRQKPNQALYNSTRWRTLARQHKAANPFCVVCDVAPVEVTDHIVPVNQCGGMWAWDNLQSLCHKCHNKKSGREAHVR